MQASSTLVLLLSLPGSASLGLLHRLGRVPAHPGVPNTTLSWHAQPLDHFDYAEPRTFQQRVFVSDHYWNKQDPRSPLFFYCGNEANVELYVNATGLMWEQARSFSALLIFAEHRYYGETLPFGGESAKNASTLRWLTMEQALADYATLIYELKQRLGVPDAPVIAFGGSYGGMLAAWLRMHYPSAVDGAIAASAPVLAFDGLLHRAWDSNSYWRVVSADASSAAGSAPECAAEVRATWPVIFDLGASAAGRSELSNLFRLCSVLKGADDVTKLAAWLLNLWDTLAMGNFPYASNYLVFQQTQDPSVTLPPWPFRVACSAFAGPAATRPTELLLRMAKAAGVLYNASGHEQCYTVPDDPNYDGIWDYQWCTQRLPQETYFPIDGVRDIFWARPSNATAIAEHCLRKYGVSLKGNWVAATSEFGGVHSASNIVFSNGEYDPWRSGGVLTNLSSSLVAVDIAEGAHHLDLMFSNEADPPSVRAARKLELAAIRRWVAEKIA